MSSKSKFIFFFLLVLIPVFGDEPELTEEQQKSIDEAAQEIIDSTLPLVENFVMKFEVYHEYMKSDFKKKIDEYSDGIRKDNLPKVKALISEGFRVELQPVKGRNGLAELYKSS